MWTPSQAWTSTSLFTERAVRAERTRCSSVTFQITFIHGSFEVRPSTSKRANGHGQSREAGDAATSIRGAWLLGMGAAYVEDIVGLPRPFSRVCFFCSLFFSIKT